METNKEDKMCLYGSDSIQYIYIVAKQLVLCYEKNFKAVREVYSIDSI